MRPELLLNGIRGSIFVPQIQFSWNLVYPLLEYLKDYIPSVNVSGGPQFLNGQIVNPGEWSLVAPNNKCRLCFSVQKIDMIKEVGQSYNKNDIVEFSKFCNDVFSLVMDKVSVKSNRFAVAPSMQYCGDNKNIPNFVSSVYRINKFKDSIVDNCEFSQVYRSLEKINDKDVIINYLSKFYVASNVVKMNGVNQIQDSIMIDFDINSRVDPNNSFDIPTVNSFFDRSPSLINDFLNLYFHE